jgi:hypothetical protein
MTLALLNIVVALFLGYGAVEEFWIRGVRGGEAQPLVVGVVGALVSLALVAAGVARLRRSPGARQMQLLSSLALIAFHVYAALPPHRNVGILVLLVGAGYGVVLLASALAGRGGASGAAAGAGAGG